MIPDFTEAVLGDAAPATGRAHAPQASAWETPGSGQSYALYGADDLAGAGWNERCAPLIEIVDSTGAVAAAAGRSGQFVRARTDASLWLAWVDGTGAYVAADTTTATVKYCPLWRTLRGSL